MRSSRGEVDSSPGAGKLAAMETRHGNRVDESSGTRFRGLTKRQYLLLPCVLAFTACMPRLHSDFRVVPATPNYILLYPDSHQATFADILRMYNGFEPGRPWVDLRPGMELRIEDAYYEPGASRRELAGFLGTEVAQYKMRSNGGLQLVSLRLMKNAPSGQAPVQQLIPAPQKRHRQFRFYYEVLFKRGGESHGSVLLSANASAEISRLTAELTSDPDSVCNERSGNCTVFPDACSVSVEMEIVVNGSPLNVVWGAVLSDIAKHPHHLELVRIYQGRLTPVKLDANDTKALRLPLLPGDHVKWS